MTRRTLFLCVLVASAATLDGLHGTALAKGGKGNRVRDRVTLVAQAFQGRARLTLRRDGADRQEMKLQVEGAATGLDLRAFVEDAAGVLTEVAPLTEGRAGQYVWRVRTKKGDALPFGQSDLSGLSGRKVEIRTAAGVTAFGAVFPVVSVVKAPVFAKRALRTNLAVDRGVAKAIGAPGLVASTTVGRRRGGHQRFGVHVANAVSGQTFEVWIQDPVTGKMVYLRSIVAGAPPAAKDGSGGTVDGSGDDDDADDDGVDDEHEDEGDLDFDSDDGDDLPGDAASVSDLAGLNVEIRTDSGDVVAEGEVAAVGDSPRADDDDDDGVEDGTEDESEDD